MEMKSLAASVSTAKLQFTAIESSSAPRLSTTKTGLRITVAE